MCCPYCENLNPRFGPLLIGNIFVFILFLVPIISSLITTSIDMDPGETRVLNYGSSTFVHSVSLLTAGNDVDVYYLPKPELSHAPDTAQYRNREDFTLGPEEYVNYQHFLNRGTKVDLTFSAEKGAIHMYMLKSEATWSKWKETFYDGKHYSTYWSSTDIYRYSSNRATQHVRYDVKEDDLYVIVFLNENWRQGAQVHLDYSIFKTNYVVPPAVKPVCGPDAEKPSEYEDDNGWCRLSVLIHDKNVILLTTPNVALPFNANMTIGTMSQSTDDVAEEKVFTLSYSCSFRTGYMLCMLLVCCCCCLCGCGGLDPKGCCGSSDLLEVMGVGRRGGYESVELSSSSGGVDVHEAASTTVTTQPIVVATVVQTQEGEDRTTLAMKEATAPSLMS